MQMCIETLQGSQFCLPFFYVSHDIQEYRDGEASLDGVQERTRRSITAAATASILNLLMQT